MKKILLFSFIIFIIPIIVLNYFIIYNDNTKFVFSKNTYVRVKLTKENKIINVPIEEYVYGVVAGEMPASFNTEALKAQAVAARSYVMYKIKHNKKKSYDVEDTVLNQVYLSDKKLQTKWGNNYSTYSNKIKEAVNDTAYEYITYNGEIADALFFSSSYGYTENSEDVFVSKLDYLKSVKSDWDKDIPRNVNNIVMSKDEFMKKLNINKISIESIKKTNTGMVDYIIITNKKYTGKEFVNIFNLKSRCFEVKVDDKITIITKGNGHGVGMSQYGAQGMAKAGYKYKEILNYYYSNIKIEKIK